MTFVAMSFLFRRTFCSWLCRVGTLSQSLGKIGKKVFGRNFDLTRWIDIPLRGLNYLLLGFLVWAVSSMSAKAISAFMLSPYGVVADVNMLNFFQFIGHTGLIVLGALGIVSVFSPFRNRRNVATGIDCANGRRRVLPGFRSTR
jgi:polyferredoxin